MVDDELVLKVYTEATPIELQSILFCITYDNHYLAIMNTSLTIDRYINMSAIIRRELDLYPTLYKYHMLEIESRGPQSAFINLNELGWAVAKKIYYLENKFRGN